jgi:hypothetical protein
MPPDVQPRQYRVKSAAATENGTFKSVPGEELGVQAVGPESTGPTFSQVLRCAALLTSF